EQAPGHSSPPVNVPVPVPVPISRGGRSRSSIAPRRGALFPALGTPRGINRQDAKTPEEGRRVALHGVVRGGYRVDRARGGEFPAQCEQDFPATRNESNGKPPISSSS